MINLDVSWYNINILLYYNTPIDSTRHVKTYTGDDRPPGVDLLLSPGDLLTVDCPSSVLPSCIIHIKVTISLPIHQNNYCSPVLCLFIYIYI